MPELPEVEVVRAGLEPALVGARIDTVQVFDLAHSNVTTPGAVTSSACFKERRFSLPSGEVSSCGFLWIQVMLLLLTWE